MSEGVRGVYTVNQGDNLTLIAVQCGFADHSYIYDHPQNANLKGCRESPDVLHPGDRVVIPKPRARDEACHTGKLHRFLLKIPRKTLRIVVRDSQDQPLADAPYVLTIKAAPAAGRGVPETETKTYPGTTGADGLLECDVPLNAAKGTLEIAGNLWDLCINHLNPPNQTFDDGISGIQARLENLGFDPGPVDGKDGPRTRAAISRFQRKYPPLKVDGICGPMTLEKLVAMHGS